MIRPEESVTPDVRGWAPSAPQLLLAGVLLTVLWALTLLGLSPLFQIGDWLWRALAICTAVILPACLLRMAAPRLRGAAALGGVIVGSLCWLWWLARAEHGELWLLQPRAAVEEVVILALQKSAPMLPSGPFEDLLLFAVLILAAMSITVLIGLGKPLVSGILPSLLLLVPPAVTGLSAGSWSLLGAGALLALLAWIASPRPSALGLVAAASAVAVAAGAVAIAPATRDRVWNDQVMLGPLSVTVPDVTIALAEDLRERSQTRAFRYSSAGSSGPTHIVLATLADFEGGRWLPQETLNADGLTVVERRLDTTIPAAAVGNGWASAAHHTVTITIEGLLTPWLPLPAGAIRVTSVDRNRFDPEQWVWAEHANTARSESAVTRIGDRYNVEVRPTASLVGVRLEIEEPAFAPETGVGDPYFQMVRAYPDPLEAPAELQPYLALPDGRPELLEELAQQATQGAEGRLAIGTMLQQWFRDGGFAYDESAPYLPGSDPNDPYAVMTALLTDRRGFCVHYASTFAVMARHLGVPTRVAIGYAFSEQGAREGVVRGGDLHAWPEIFVEGVGWVAFEPTPGGPGSRESTPEEQPVIPEQAEAPETPEEAPALEEEPQENEAPIADPADDARGSGSEGNGAALNWAAAVLGVLAALALLTSPALVRAARSWRRRSRIERGDRPAHHAWSEFLDTAIDLGLLSGAPPPTSTAQPANLPAGGRAGAPRARTAEAIVEHLRARGALPGDSATAAERLAAAMVEERYAGQSAPPVEVAAWLSQARAGLVQTVGRTHRLRAAMLPRSLVPSSRA